MNVGALVNKKLNAGSKEKEEKTRKRVAQFEKQVRKGVNDMKVRTLRNSATGYIKYIQKIRGLK